MTHRIVTSKSADVDLEGIVDYYAATAGEEVAIRFVDEVEVARDRLAAFPHSGSAYPELLKPIPGLRSMAIAAFPYALFYTSDSDVVRVHRVLHSRQEMNRAFAP